jgi:hypothetical protein
MKKRARLKIRKPVAKRPTKVILSKKDRLKKKRIKHRELLTEYL